MKTISFDIRVVADIALLGGKSTQQIAYTGKIKGERAMEDYEDIGQEVEHKFAVSSYILNLFTNKPSKTRCS